jgi:hypothetical protein
MAVASDKLMVGINYPAFNYGFDFGPPVIDPSQSSQSQPSYGPGWNAPNSNNLATISGPAPATVLEALLAVFKGFGLQVVRWFIFGDGWNLPAPKLVNKQWAYEQTALDPSYVNDFATMLKSFAKMKMKVIPVFVDNRFFWPGSIVFGLNAYNKRSEVTVDLTSPSVGSFISTYLAKHPEMVSGPKNVIDWTRFIKGGKGSILTDGKTVNTKGIKSFMDLVLEPLLSACDGYKDCIYAWDIMNEPEQGSATFNMPVDATAVFLLEGVKRVVAHGMAATIGFKMEASFDEIYFATTKTVGAQFARANFGAKYLPQFHYWPEQLPSQPDPRPQPPAPRQLRSNSIVGEFGTVVNSNATGWQAFTIDQRLAAFDGANFALALLWSAMDNDAYSAWEDAGVQAAVKQFTSR